MSLLSRFAEDTLARLRRPEENAAPACARQAAAPDTALMIACPTPTDEETACKSWQARGQFLARQDRWADLAAEIRCAEDARRATPAGMPVADLLSCGARADVVRAVEHALVQGQPAQDAPLRRGINALEEMLAEAGQDSILSTIVAHTHMDIARAWRGTVRTGRIPAHTRAAVDARFACARDILMRFDPRDTCSPGMAAAICALHRDGRSTTDQLVADYERLIDLNPHSPGPMRALGSYLSPRWFGSPARRELEARRTAARTQDIWGAGAYTWVMLDALRGEDTACADLDLEFFVEGLHDILSRTSDQQTVNLLAACCAHITDRPGSGDPAADQTRTAIAACTNWIVRAYMTELHPLIWARAAAGPDSTIRPPRSLTATGQTDALRILANLFHREIAQGNRIIFTADGPVAKAT